MSTFNAADWYWLVAGDASKLWSSKTRGYVDPTSADCVAWLGDGRAPTRIASLTELWDVLAQRAPHLVPSHARSAQAALDKTDRVALRCFKSGVPFPPAWVAYVAALRALIAAPPADPTQALPSAPAYPAGT